ncbi:hypothetical protein BHE74_00044932 [Ensete ventricosum]|uniref:Uncharacterized protein n=1 Tax=Ensete ventricosum TaxID=4639 RepID=A0A444EY60_ENSVE|nr:hypothetical protein GW17_00020898 [Ensete ventricosum]RWW48957.1 hypothetical protein BHE74_00044932 [Ensete ventricosum]RZR74253.1 hypothetical protein BHM03_00034306 [Ensete ventricosum]
MRERSKSLEGRLLEVGLEEGFRVAEQRRREGRGEWREEREEKGEQERRRRIPRSVRNGDVTDDIFEDGSVKYLLGPESDCYDPIPAAFPLLEPDLEELDRYDPILALTHNPIRVESDCNDPMPSGPPTLIEPDPGGIGPLRPNSNGSPATGSGLNRTATTQYQRPTHFNQNRIRVELDRHDPIPSAHPTTGSGFNRTATTRCPQPTHFNRTGSGYNRILSS